VSIRKPGQNNTISANSVRMECNIFAKFALFQCLIPVLQCDNWKVTTIEGVGSVKNGLSKVQHGIVKENATQCGFCTPGMAMSMESLLKRTTSPSEREVELALDGNLCRCTGYRPILDAFKSFSQELATCKVTDIEECANYCPGKANLTKSETENAPEWLHPRDLPALVQALKELPTVTRYRLVAGHTGSGVYDDGPFDTFIDISNVQELKKTNLEGMTFGGAVTIAELKHLMADKAPKVAHHLKKVAHTSVRNIATLAGNLMLANEHPEFPSDLRAIFLALEAKVNILDAKSGKKKVIKLEDFLKMDMKKKILTEIHLPELPDDHFFTSFKVMARRTNSHAIVNAAFTFPMRNGVLKSKPNLIFGGLKSGFWRAGKTEELMRGLIGKDKVFEDKAIILEICKSLQSECDPGDDPLAASPNYRRYLAVSLFYKVNPGSSSYKYAKCIIGCFAMLRRKSAKNRPERRISIGKRPLKWRTTL